MNTYKVLNKQVFSKGDYSLIPIRFEDRYNIMQWRNEQIYHLRQAEPLTKEKQDWYFENVVAQLFDQDQPSQILFSFLKGEECIGYGGLVHINWIDKNAEVSFVMKTRLEQSSFFENWSVFLQLIEIVAFHDIEFHKLFTYAYNIRPHLYPALESCGFKKEAVLKEHCFFKNRFEDVIIHAKINSTVQLRPANINDVELTYKWANSPEVRRYAFAQKHITKAEHVKWFSDRIANPKCLYYLAINNQMTIGSLRFDLDENGIALISYLLDPAFHGKGLGYPLLKAGMVQAFKNNDISSIVGYVKEDNKPSLHLFRKLGFEEEVQKDGSYKFELSVK